MEMYVAILCVVLGVAAFDAASGMENEAAMREHALAASKHERTRYESITINKPVMRFDYHSNSGHVGQFDDDITGPPSPPSSVRCFCNLPACISTGYMCKSQFGGCFSDLYPHHVPTSAAANPAASTSSGASKAAPVYRGRHGCIELLTDKGQRERCQRLPNGNRYPASARSSASKNADDYDHPRSLVHCCHEDMCNHADNQQTKDLINDTSLGDSDDSRVIGSQMNTGYSDSDVWFKAATIAVPICGAVILFVLIALAIRILKTESSNNTNYKLGCTYLHGKHGNCKHHNHPYCHQPVVAASAASEPFLRKEPIMHEQHAVYAAPPRRSALPAPITLTKNINERLQAAAAPNTTNYNYNLLPMQQARVHEKCFAFENKTISTVAPLVLLPTAKVNNFAAALEDACDIPKNSNLNSRDTH